MLFEFGYFWKTIFSLLAAWTLYGFVGFEFTVVTLLVLLLSHEFHK
jgi:hypothetical protein